MGIQDSEKTHPGSRGQKGTGFRIRIRNIDLSWIATKKVHYSIVETRTKIAENDRFDHFQSKSAQIKPYPDPTSRKVPAGVPDPWHFAVNPDPDPWIHASD